MVSTCITAQMPEEVLESWVFVSFLLAERVCKVTMGWVVLCHQDFSHHLLLARGTDPLPEQIAFPQVWQPFLSFPSHQSGWHFTGRMLFNSIAVLGWYVQPMLGHCCLLVCCSLKNKIPYSCCSLKLLLLLDKVSEERMDCIYFRNFKIRGILCFWRWYQWHCGT